MNALPLLVWSTCVPSSATDQPPPAGVHPAALPPNGSVSKPSLKRVTGEGLGAGRADGIGLGAVVGTGTGDGLSTGEGWGDGCGDGSDAVEGEATGEGATEAV